MRHRFFSLLLAVLIGIFLAGCSAEEPVEEPETTETVYETEPPQPTAAEQILTILRDSESPLPQTEAFLTWCAELTGFEVFYPAMLQALEDGYSDSDWFTVTGRTVKVLSDLYFGNETVDIRNNEAGGVVSLLFAGDINLGDGWYNMNYLEGCHRDLLQVFDPAILQLLQDADLTMLNNEFCYSRRGYAALRKTLTYRADPDNVSILQELGIDIVSLANNHVYDYMRNAFLDTLDTLENAGIAAIGAGKDIDSAAQPYYCIINGVKLAFVSACEVPVAKKADTDVPGVFYVGEDAERLRQTIEEASVQSDYVIVYLHWGMEEDALPDDDQTTLAHLCVDAGASLVVGSHPRFFQSIEYYNDTPVVYSLGNFWYSNNLSKCLLLRVSIDARGIGLQLNPCRQRNAVVTLVNGQEDGYLYLQQIVKNSDGIYIAGDGTVSRTIPAPSDEAVVSESHNSESKDQ